MKEYIVDDRTEGYNQLGPFRAANIRMAVNHALKEWFKKYNPAVEIVDQVHAWIVLELPGGAKHEYEVGETGT